ncbi:MAG: DUF2029 domain-containing protein [Verrucomicrobia bacterium]|nr:DUF2029 domain-containing protein [Verrucomicrobiota bacterium]
MVLKAVPKPGRWFENPRVQTWLALAVWIVPLLVISGMVIHDPSRRSVVPVYHQAVENWWAQQSLYAGWSYHYLPQFAVLFMPFHLLPSPVGDLLWRFFSAGLLVSGIWRLSRQQFGSEAARAFLLITLLAMPLTLGALRNGQANVLLAALTLQAVACLSPRQWWAAAVFMVLAVAVKLIGIVLILLAVSVYSPLRWRLAFAFAAVAALPFLFGSSSYVISQHREAFEHFGACAAVTGHWYADLGGMVRTFGGELNAGFSKWMRVLAGGALLGVWWLGARRLAEPARAMWLHGLATSYLMLFNPMTETNSYAIVAPAFGWWAVWAWDEPRTRRVAWGWACLCLAAGIVAPLLWRVFGNELALFLRPAMTIVFVAMLIYFRWWIIALAEGPRIKPA